MFKKLTLLVLSLVLIGFQQLQAQEHSEHGVEYINQRSSFSEVVRVGNMLYLTGKLGFKDRQLAPGGIKEETRQTLENIKAVLEKNGSSMDHVVKVTVFLADIKEWADMNEVYKTFFPKNRPARSAVGVSGLARDARVEIECIAVVAQESHHEN